MSNFLEYFIVEDLGLTNDNFQIFTSKFEFCAVPLFYMGGKEHFLINDPFP